LKPYSVPRAALALAICTPVSQPTLADTALEEVIVTAQKREQTLQDIPSSVTAISEEALAKTNTRSFSDLNNITAGVSIVGGPGGARQVIRIRGVGTNNDVPAIRPAVGIFLDEIPLAQTESAYTNMADIERVEILKGPQSTLFGKEVSSGAISLFTKRPHTDAFSGYLEANWGNVGLQEYRLGANLPMTDKVAMRASAYQTQRDGSVDNTTTGDDDMGEVDNHGYRLRLLLEPNDNLSAILGYEDHNVEVYGTTSVAQEYGDLFSTWEQRVEGITNPGQSQLIILDPADRETSALSSLVRKTITEIWSLKINWILNDKWSAHSVTSDQAYTLSSIGIDGSSFVNSSGQHVPDLAATAVGPYKLGAFYQQAETDSFTQEFRIAYDSDNWSSILGAFYADTEISSYVPFTSLLGAFSPDFIIYAAGVSDIYEETTEWALFNHNIYTLREGLEFTFGMRYSAVKKDSTKGQLTGWGPLADLNHPLVPITPWGATIPGQKDNWSDLTGTAKATWWVDDDVSVYGGWDRGFKAGGHNVCKGSEEIANCPVPFESEIADNFEVGFKGRFLDNTLAWNASAFYQIYSDYQVEIQDEEGIGNSVKNAAKVGIQGAETEFQWLANEHLLIDGSVAYIDARWDEYDDAGCLRPQYQTIACDPETLTQDLSGHRLNYTSPWSANLNATWSDELGSGINWYVRGELAFRDDRLFFPDLDPEVTDSSYTLLNASLGFSAAAGNWDVILWGKNLTDEGYLRSANRNRDAGNPAFGTTPFEGYAVTAGDQRTYGITLKYRFGDS
jgi:iron complex outermembrane receptor protein